MPTPAQARSLYRELMRQGSKFSNYNVREYIWRRTREEFRVPRDAAGLEAAWRLGQEELAVAKRQAVVYGLYAREHKNVMELGPEAAA